MVVVITGASAGIGLALSRELSEHGALLVLSARRKDRLEQLNASLGGQHLVFPADVADSMDCLNLIRAAHEKFGRIDTLVCNAGYGEMRPLSEMSAQQVKAMFAVNLLGTTECIRAALPRMLEQQPRDGFRGQILIVSSAVARRALPMFGVYAATKAAQLSIAESLRLELRGTAVAVSSVHPVGTETEFFHVAEEKGGRHMAPRPAWERTQKPEAVARAMLRAIQRPRPEIWPYPPARWGLSFSTLFPSLTDWVIARARIGTEDRNAN